MVTPTYETCKVVTLAIHTAIVDYQNLVVMTIIIFVCT